MNEGSQREDQAQSRTPRCRVRLTGRDRALLQFVADHRLVLGGHVRVLLDISAAAAYARLRSLTVAGFLHHRRLFHLQPGCYQVTHRGLAAAESKLPVPRLDLSCYEHDVGVAWLWLAARAGALGAVREVLSERRLRSWDAMPGDRAEPRGVRLGGPGPGGKPRLHYPDLLLTDRAGRLIGIELELSPKGRTRREKIIAGYSVDRRIHRVLYLTPERSIASKVRASAATLGASDLVRVQLISHPGEVSRGGVEHAAVRGHRQERRSTANALGR